MMLKVENLRLGFMAGKQALAAAFAAMFVLVLAANLFADAVRDAFDPRAA